jgi:DNA mismatch repair protein MutS
MNSTRFAPQQLGQPPAAEGRVPPADGASPFLAQYLAIKAEHPDHLLFFRMGDFYELFFEDAGVAAGALDIALTRRGRHKDADIPMCGVPVHAADGYLARLIRAGHKVAICEQIEDPAEARKRGSKAVLRRAVVRIVTPGTLSEDSLLDAGRHNYLAALAHIGGARGSFALAWADISTGDCYAEPLAPDLIGPELARIRPGELLLPERLYEDPDFLARLGLGAMPLTPLPGPRFDSEGGGRRAASHFGVATLDGFGRFGRAELAALGALLDYVALTQKGAMPQMKPPRQEEPGGVLLIDPATRANLEVVEGADGGKRGSLLGAIDETRTSAGARLLRERLLSPSTDVTLIARRQDAVSWFLTAEGARTRTLQTLSRVPDLARALQRLALGRGGPRDLAALRDGLGEADALSHGLDEPGSLAPPPAEIVDALGALRGFDALTGQLGAALADSPPVDAREGGFIREGFDAVLDELRALRSQHRDVILGLEQRYRTAAGVPGLKIRHNNVLGYFIEVTPLHGDKMLDPAQAGLFIHRQTLVSGLRFTTTELAGLEQRIAEAGAKALERELDFFRTLRDAVLARAQGIGAAADALARLDVAASLSGLAQKRQWARPAVTDSRRFSIRAGRHPVVEAALERQAASFVPNDCELSEEEGARLWLVTGPNMAGKSTFLRQNALIAILAQAGAFVPAASAEIGIIDRLFSRVGAADDLARGRSTFMVEMVETAAILNQATPRSLVILDEIGRGTATFDGLSIAWAALEHLHEVNRARGLFATHYHELTALTARLPFLSAVTMRVKEWQGDIVFLHEVVKGAADRSYGIHVAKLAGLPAPVIARAQEILNALEAGDDKKKPAALIEELPLFAAAASPARPPAPGAEILEALAGLNPDSLSAREALELVYGLVEKARKLGPY